MKKVLISILLTIVFAPVTLRAQGNHEYAPVQEKTVNYKNWTLNDLANNKPVSLRSLMQFRVDYIVVHTDLYPPGEWAQVERRLANFQERIELRHADDTGRVYALRRDRDLTR